MTARRSNHDREIRARFQSALSRPELRLPTVPRVASASPTSMAVKVQDEETRRLIDEALAKRGGGLT